MENIKKNDSEISLLAQLEGIETLLNLSQFSKRYFGKTKSWLFQRLHGWNVAAIVVCLAVTTLFASCDKKNGDETTHCPCFERDLPEGSTQNWKTVESGFVGIENISLENYPKVDGSTSGNILNWMVACKLFRY